MKNLVRRREISVDSFLTSTCNILPSIEYEIHVVVMLMYDNDENIRNFLKAT